MDVKGVSGDLNDADRDIGAMVGYPLIIGDEVVEYEAQFRCAVAAL